VTLRTSGPHCVEIYLQVCFMFPSVGHHHFVEADMGPRDDGFKVVYDLDHTSESAAEL
jgi:hypothetical protein